MWRFLSLSTRYRWACAVGSPAPERDQLAAKVAQACFDWASTGMNGLWFVKLVAWTTHLTLWPLRKTVGV